jgi:predicted ATP-dependent endonuclease of OLD family
MHLKRVELHGYRSVPESVTLHIGSTMTCLIGANEHGKSNILEAINLLDGGTFDTYDKYSHSKKSDHPRLLFGLHLLPVERRGLVQALQQEIDLWSSTPEAPDKTKAISLFQSSIDRLKQDLETVELTLSSDGVRALRVASITYAFSKSARPVKAWLEGALPSVRLFTPPADLVDSITLPELKARSNLPFEGLLKLAGIWDTVDDLFEDSTAGQRLAVQAGRNLTRRIRKIWTQGAAHTLRFHQSSGRLHLTIEDPTTFDVPSRRSLGFRSFFSFYLTLFAETEDVEPHGFILLFDEPGIHLHPQGQKDLLKELRSLSRNNQIVYTTHSPFLLDRNNPSGTVLVKKGMKSGNRGTHIITRPYGENWGILNDALGIGPEDAFYPADRLLLVEGRSDRLYITKIMTLCQSHTKADLNFLSIVDSERREEMEDFLRLVLRGDRRVVVLADGDQGGDALAKRLRKVVGSRSNQLEFIDLRKILGTAKEVSIEDALPESLWLDAVEKYRKELLKAGVPIDRAEISHLARSATMGRAAAEYFVSANLLPKVTSFSKTSVADFFSKEIVPVPSEKDPMVNVALEITRSLGLAD